MLTIPKLKKMKKNGQPIAMITAYDYPSATLVEEAGADLILVGDSLGNVILGYDTTVQVTLQDMIHHAKAVVRGAQQTMVITDMPFGTYRLGAVDTYRNAIKMMQETGCQAVKMEGGSALADEIRHLVNAGIPVMGHLGLTPQSIHQIGGFIVQGKHDKDAKQMLRDAQVLQEAGVFAIVLELVPESVAAKITETLHIPTIGIGGGRFCDGQVLVYHDLLKYGSHMREKKMVQTYADIGNTVRDAVSQYVKEVHSRVFPTEQHSFHYPAKQTTERDGFSYGSKKIK